MKQAVFALVALLYWPTPRALSQDAGVVTTDSSVVGPDDVADSAPADDPGAQKAPVVAAPAPPATPQPDPFAQAEAALVEPHPGPSLVAPDDSLFQVEGIDIVARLDQAAVEAPGSVFVLDAKQLERLNYDDAKQVLAQVPGVYVRQEDGYGLRPNIGLRGADADRSKKITLLEDGVLFGPAPYSAPAAYYFPVMTRMTGVEVWKGASAIRYGPQTIGGALDLHTREVPSHGKVAAMDASFGNTYFTKLHGYAGYGEARFGLITEGVHLSSTGYKQLDGGGDTGFGKQELMLKGRVNTDPEGHVFQQLALKLGYAREESNETYLGLADEDFRKTPRRRYAASRLDGFDYNRTQAELRHLLSVGEHFELQTVVYRHDFGRLWNRLDGLVNETTLTGDDSLPSLKEITDNVDAEATRPYLALLRGQADSDVAGGTLLLAGNRRRFVSQGVQTVGRYDFARGAFKHRFELGLRVHHDRIRRRHTATSYAMLAGQPVPDDVARPLLAHNEVQTVAIAAHGVYDLTLYDLTLSPGVRTEIIRSTYTERLGPDAGQSRSFDPNVVLFALGGRYAVSDAVALLAGVQQGMTPVAPTLPAADEGGTRRGRPPLRGQVERAVNYEAGARYVAGENQASVIGFVSDYDNIVSPCEEQCPSGGASSSSFTSGAALVYGLELGGYGQLPLAGGFVLPVSASYTYTHAEFVENFETENPLWAGSDGKVAAGDGLPYIAPHQFSLGAGVAYRQKVGLDLALNYMDRTRETAGQGALISRDATDRYALLDGVAFYQALDNLRIYLKGDNLTNRQPLVSRRPFGARPNKPLLVQIGVRWEL